ncbi:MAG: DUF2752 domain-containing protein, partial [Planctomycetota bacterium]
MADVAPPSGERRRSPIRIERASRRVVPGWAAALVLAWLGLVGAAELLRPTDVSTSLCNFRRLFGLPCPTCGCTRGALALFAGRPLEAVA